MKRLLLLALLLPAALHNQAQDYSGRWTGETESLFNQPSTYQVITRGVRRWEMTTGFNPCTITVTLEQSGQMFTGTIRHEYRNEPGWLVHEISGLIINNHAVLTESQVVDHANIDRYYFATFEGDITIDSAANKMILKGKVFDRYHKTYDIWTKAMKMEFISTGQFTVTKPIVPKPVIRRLPEKPPFSPIPERKTINPPPVVIIAADDWQQRERAVVHTFDVVSDSLQLDFYDDSNIDDDTITVYYNKNVLISNRRLTDKPLSIKVPVITGIDNEIVMFANNVGSIPPNTALLVFYDDGVRKEIRIDSDMKKSGTIIFRKK